MNIKNFVLQECYTLNVTKSELLAMISNKKVSEIIDNYVFELNMPWLVANRFSFITKEDYNHLCDLVQSANSRTISTISSAFNTIGGFVVNTNVFD